MPAVANGFWRACRRFSEYGDNCFTASGYYKRNAPGGCKASEWLQRLSAPIGRETIREKAVGLPAAYFGGYRRDHVMAEDIRIEYRALDDILEYENNPRRNDDAVAAVAESMKEFGCRQPIVIDADGIIVAGHTRYKAARLLKWEKMPCILADDLTEEQIRAYRLADNKTAEASEWDEQRLAVELSEILDIDMSRFGFEDEESLADVIDEEKYSMATNIPQYEIKGDCPELSDLLDTEKSDELVAEIENADVTEEEKEFLRYAAQRHNVFNYRNVAEYYAHATPQMQELMEKSALVIIDVDNAIANGYATLQAEILDIMED